MVFLSEQDEQLEVEEGEGYLYPLPKYDCCPGIVDV